jgi:hypothetical protein
MLCSHGFFHAFDDRCTGLYEVSVGCCSTSICGKCKEVRDQINALSNQFNIHSFNREEELKKKKKIESVLWIDRLPVFIVQFDHRPTKYYSLSISLAQGVRRVTIEDMSAHMLTHDAQTSYVETVHDDDGIHTKAITHSPSPTKPPKQVLLATHIYH